MLKLLPVQKKISILLYILLLSIILQYYCKRKNKIYVQKITFLHNNKKKLNIITQCRSDKRHTSGRALTWCFPSFGPAGGRRISVQFSTDSVGPAELQTHAIEREIFSFFFQIRGLYALAEAEERGGSQQAAGCRRNLWHLTDAGLLQELQPSSQLNTHKCLCRYLYLPLTPAASVLHHIRSLLTFPHSVSMSCHSVCSQNQFQ